MAAPHLSGRAVALALGAYGRRELTPRGEIELLLLHDGGLSRRTITETVLRPLWQHDLRLEPIVRTADAFAAEVQRSVGAMLTVLDARLIAGEAALAEELLHRIVEPLRRDRLGLRRRVLADVARRHANAASVVEAAAPDLIDGRGGLRDLRLLRWLQPDDDPRCDAALDFLLQVTSSAEDLVGHPVHRLSARLQERVGAAIGLGPDELIEGVYRHARWVAFRLDGALAEPRTDRAFGLSLHLRRGELHGERLASLERVPSLGLSVANLVGFAPPDARLLEWASQPGPPVTWDAATRDQLFLLLRAADWRSWEFLDVTGLLQRYIPEWQSIAHRRGAAGDAVALDRHSFLALRRLHEWVESSDAFATRLARALRRRDFLYLAVLLHELGTAAADCAQRMGLPDDGVAAIRFLAEHRGLLAETAALRDVHDEDMLYDVAARIGTSRRLRALVLLTAAHELAVGGTAWTGWKAAQLRQLFTLLDRALRQGSEVGARRQRSVDHHRERVAKHLERRGLHALLPQVGRLPRRYLLSRSPAFIARHLALAGGAPLQDGEVRLQARRHRGTSVWDVYIVARDRPGLLASMSGVLALRGASVLAADAATCSDGLVLDVFTVTSAHGTPLPASLWPRVANDLQRAVDGKLPLAEVLAGTADAADEVRVSIDNTASEFFSVVEVRAADRVGLLYRIARALYESGLDIHHAKVATHPEGALDVFYVWDLSGKKLDESVLEETARQVAARIQEVPCH